MQSLPFSSTNPLMWVSETVLLFRDIFFSNKSLYLSFVKFVKLYFSFQKLNYHTAR